ncbi:Quinone oxidoreductase protein [Globisporangium polare]
MTTTATPTPTTFQAYQYDNYGDLRQELKLRTDVQMTPLQDTHVRIRVHAAALNPCDPGLIERWGLMLTGRTPSKDAPFGFGLDASGTIVEVGSAVAGGLQVGDAVFAMAPFSGFGTLAEYIAIDAQLVARKPASLSFEQATGVPLTALTSYQALFEHAKLVDGERVLILGGSTATGIFAIQLAKSVGAYVIATASPRNMDFVRSLGADEVIDYTAVTKWVDAIEPHTVHVVYDCGTDPDAWNSGAQQVLKRSSAGRFVALLPPTADPIGSSFGAVSLGYILVHPSGSQLLAVAKLIDSGVVTVYIDSVFTFDKVFDAIARLESKRAVGKIVVQVRTTAE